MVFSYTTALKVSFSDVTIPWDLNPCIQRIPQQDVLQLNHVLCYKLLLFVYVEHAANWFPLTGPASCFGREWKSLLIQLWKSGPKRICKSLAKVSVCTFSTGI